MARTESSSLLFTQDPRPQNPKHLQTLQQSLCTNLRKCANGLLAEVVVLVSEAFKREAVTDQYLVITTVSGFRACLSLKGQTNGAMGASDGHSLVLCFLLFGGAGGEGGGWRGGRGVGGGGGGEVPNVTHSGHS